MKLKIKNLIKFFSKKKLIKVGIIGGGFGYYGHYKAFQKISSCKVVAIVTKKKLNLPKSTKIYNSVKKLITNEKLDLISIATVPKIQQGLFSKLIEYGANLFIEKPLGVNYLICKKKLIKVKKLKVAINFTFPEISEFIYFKKKFIKNETKFISINWFFKNLNKSIDWKQKREMGGGIIFNYFTHSLYYIEFLFGKILKINIIKKTKTLFICKIITENNRKINFSLNSNYEKKSKHEIILNEKNSIRLFSPNALRFDRFNIYVKNKKVIIPNNIKINGMDKRYLYVAKLLKRYINAINSNKSFRPDYFDGLTNLKWLNKIEKI